MGSFTKKLRGHSKRGQPDPAAQLKRLERTTHALVERREGRLALRLVGELDDYVDVVAAEAPRREEWGCGAGCTYCCHLRVVATAPELARIATAIDRREDADAIRARVAETDALFRHMTEAELFSVRLPCPLLDADGRCSTYAVRPLACRGLVSLSRETCRRNHEDADSSDEAESASDPVIDKLRNDTDVHLAVALTNAGLDPLGYELTSGLARLFATDVDRWAEPELFAEGRVFSGSLEFQAGVRELIRQLAEL